MLTSTRLDRERELARSIVQGIRDGPARAYCEDEGQRSLLAWAQEYLPQYVTEEPSQFHRELFAVLETMRSKRGQRHLTIAPRGSAKSTCCSVIAVLHAICEGYEPYIVIGSDTSGQAQLNLESIKHELEHNSALAHDYPAAVGTTRQQTWHGSRIVTRNGIMVEALGSSQRIRGRRKGEQRPSLIVMDDPDSDEAMYSETIRTRVRDRFLNSWLKAGEPQTNVIVVGTMIHEECLVAHLRGRPGWSGKSVYKSIISWPVHTELWEEWERVYFDGEEEAANAFYREHQAEMDEGAVVLWPAREPLLALMKTRAQDGYASFLREKQNEPLPPEGTRFDIRWFEGEDLWWDEIPKTLPKKEPAVAFCALDPATGKDSKRGDYSAIVWCWWVPGDRHLYIDADIERRPIPQTTEVMVHLAREHGFRVAGVEAIAFQSVVADNIGSAMTRAGFLVPIQPIQNHENKFQRIDRLGLYLQARNFKFRRGSVGATRLVRQLRNYSNPPSDKLDGPDALEMLTQLVRKYVKERQYPGGQVNVAGVI